MSMRLTLMALSMALMLGACSEIGTEDIPGDDAKKVSLGFNFRPTGETVFKLNYVRGRARDRFNNPSDFADFLFSVATYF